MTAIGHVSISLSDGDKEQSVTGTSPEHSFKLLGPGRSLDFPVGAVEEAMCVASLCTFLQT